MNSSRRAPGEVTARSLASNDADMIMIRLLSQRFGDGLVYLADDADEEILRLAVESGLVSADGHLTRAGHRLLQRSLRD